MGGPCRATMPPGFYPSWLMHMSNAPSTQWKEVVAPDEAQRFAGYAHPFAELQARKSQEYGAGRGPHRKQLTAA